MQFTHDIINWRPSIPLENVKTLDLLLAKTQDKILKAFREEGWVQCRHVKKPTPSQKILLSYTSFTFVDDPENNLSLHTNKIVHTTTYQIMRKSLIDLALPSKERKNSKRSLNSLGRSNWTSNHIKIIYQILEARLQVTNKLEFGST